MSRNKNGPLLPRAHQRFVCAFTAWSGLQCFSSTVQQCLIKVRRIAELSCKYINHKSSNHSSSLCLKEGPPPPQPSDRSHVIHFSSHMDHRFFWGRPENTGTLEDRKPDCSMRKIRLVTRMPYRRRPGLAADIKLGLASGKAGHRGEGGGSHQRGWH